MMLSQLAKHFVNFYSQQICVRGRGGGENSITGRYGIESLEDRTLLSVPGNFDVVERIDQAIVTDLKDIAIDREIVWFVGNDRLGTGGSDSIAFLADANLGDDHIPFPEGIDAFDAFFAVDANVDAGHAVIGGEARGPFGGQHWFGGADAIIQVRDVFNGSLIKTIQVGGAGNEVVSDVKLNSTGFVVAVQTDSPSFFGHVNQGQDDIVIIQFDKDCNPLWSRSLGTAGDDSDARIAVSPVGTIGVTFTTFGEFAGQLFGNGDVALAYLDQEGTSTVQRLLGTPGPEEAAGIATDGSGDFFATGITFASLFGPANGTTNFFVSKFNSTGNFAWGVQHNGNAFDDVNSINFVTDGSGSYISVAGATASNPYLGQPLAVPGPDNGFIAGFDPANGNLLPERVSFHGSTGEHVSIRQHTSSSNGSLFAVGGVGSDTFVARREGTVNDNSAPLLDSTKVGTFSPINEDVPDSDNSGTLVRDIFGDGISDVDGDPAGIVVIDTNQTNGELQFSIDSGTSWNAFGVVLPTSGIVLDDSPDSFVRYVPNKDFFGTVDGVFMYRAWDGTDLQVSGTAGVDASIVGGETPFSTNSASVSITVDPVNDPPTIDRVSHQVAYMGADKQTIQFKEITGGGGENQTVFVRVLSDVGLFDGQPEINPTNSNSTMELCYTPSATASGTASVTVQVSESIEFTDVTETTFAITIYAADFGDLPDTAPFHYHTLLENNGPRHVITDDGPTFDLLHFPSIDAEPDGKPTALADGDDKNGLDDEGFIAVNVLHPLAPGKMAKVSFPASAPGYVSAWIDFLGVHQFHPEEDRIAAAVPVVQGENEITFPVPVDATVGKTGARFRITSSPEPLLPTGLALDGEVEDFFVEIVEPVSVSISTSNPKEIVEGGLPFATIFFVTLNQPSGSPVTVEYFTKDGAATAGEDYESRSGTITFSPGETEKRIAVETIDDDIDEEDRQLYLVHIRNPTGARLSIHNVVDVEIIDDDVDSPSQPKLNADSDSGVSDSDNITNENEVTISGTGKPGNGIFVHNQVVLLGVTSADENGDWSLTIGPLPDGESSIAARASDSIGERVFTSELSEIFELTIDTTRPVGDFIGVTPNPRSTSVDIVLVSFNEEVVSESFTLEDVTLKRNGAAVPLDSSVTISRIANRTYQISGLDPFTDDNGTLSLEIDMTGIQDIAGNSGDGTSEVSWEKVNDTRSNGGDVTVRLSGKTIVIRGDASDNRLHITPGSIVISGMDGTTVNGETEPVRFTHAQSIDINLGRGDNVVALEGEGQFVVPDNLRIVTGRGDDLVQINDVQVGGSTVIRTSRGDDNIRVMGDRPMGGLSIHTGGDDDRVDIDNAVLSSLRVKTGSGDDHVSIVDSVIRGRSNVDTHSGNDDLSIIGALFDAKLSIRTSSGDDKLTLDDSRFKSHVFARTGSGDDHVEIEGKQTNKPSHFEARMKLKTGAGRDYVSFGSQAAPSDIAVFDGSRLFRRLFALSILGGHGEDRLDLWHELQGLHERNVERIGR